MVSQFHFYMTVQVYGRIIAKMALAHELWQYKHRTRIDLTLVVLVFCAQVVHFRSARLGSRFHPIMIRSKATTLKFTYPYRHFCHSRIQNWIKGNRFDTSHARITVFLQYSSAGRMMFSCCATRGPIPTDFFVWGHEAAPTI